MSRNWIPGFGKSGIVRTSAARSRSGRGGSAIMAPPFPSVRSMLLVGPDVPVRQIGENAEDAQEQEGGPAHRIRCTSLGSAVHTRQAVTSLAIAFTSFGHPSPNVTWPSVSGGAIARLRFAK